jgi:hypothetical protein
LAEGFEASGLGSRSIFFFKDWGEDGYCGLVCGGMKHFFWGVTRDCDQGFSWREFAGGGARATIAIARPPCGPDFFRGDVVGWEVNAIDSSCQCYIGAGVDEESSFQFAVLSSQFLDDMRRFAGQRFQVSGGEIFLPELDVIDASACGSGDVVEETAAADWVVARKRGAIGDVIEERGFGHRLSLSGSGEKAAAVRNALRSQWWCGPGKGLFDHASACAN